MSRFVAIFFLMVLFVPPEFSVADSSIRITWAAEDGFAIRTLSNGAFVYSDRDYVFSNLPTCLIDKSYLLTPNRSKFTKENQLVRLAHEGAFVTYIGYDERYKTRPDWLGKEYNFVPDMEANVVNPRSNNRVMRFVFYRSKSLARPGRPIQVGGNIAPQERKNYGMYTAVFVPAGIECPGP